MAAELTEKFSPKIPLAAELMHSVWAAHIHCVSRLGITFTKSLCDSLAFGLMSITDAFVIFDELPVLMEHMGQSTLRKHKSKTQGFELRVVGKLHFTQGIVAARGRKPPQLSFSQWGG
ncbi:hypothetical protein [Celeribacter halophilus]|uniref:hypothetical protein n=1 Tax=Celeribacter halophilus TaxID=576117 RepID=UPI003A8D9832